MSDIIIPVIVGITGSVIGGLLTAGIVAYVGWKIDSKKFERSRKIRHIESWRKMTRTLRYSYESWEPHNDNDFLSFYEALERMDEFESLYHYLSSDTVNKLKNESQKKDIRLLDSTDKFRIYPSMDFFIETLNRAINEIERKWELRFPK